jgi:hypothetical protein
MPLQKVTSVLCATVRADSIVLQTGNARSFAMEMFEEASERGFFATCLDMEVRATATTPCACNCYNSLSSLESLTSFAEMHAPRFA